VAECLKDRCSAVLSASECLVPARDMDVRAAKNTGDIRADLLGLAQGWRYAARVAHWQDEWAKSYSFEIIQ